MDFNLENEFLLIKKVLREATLNNLYIIVSVIMNNMNKKHHIFIYDIKAEKIFKIALKLT